MQILLLSKNQSIVACNTQEQVGLIVGGLTMLQRQGEFRARRARPRTSVGASAQMAEFAPALMVFILAVAFPMINLLSFGAGYAALAFLGQQCAVQASNATSYQQALVEMKTQANTIAGSGIGQFAKLAPVGGFQGCGADLWLTETDINTKVVKQYGPNTGLTGGPADPTNKIYEYTVRTSYNVGPFLNLASFPFIGDVPLVGKAVLVSTSSSRSEEHDDSLSMGIEHRVLIGSLF